MIINLEVTSKIPRGIRSHNNAFRKRCLELMNEHRGRNLKKATIVIELVEESIKRANDEIVKEILESLSEGAPRIPWCKRIKEVTVRGNNS